MAPVANLRTPCFFVPRAPRQRCGAGVRTGDHVARAASQPSVLWTVNLNRWDWWHVQGDRNALQFDNQVEPGCLRDS
jgi:hypothetical protein